jgi:glucose uptake protein GlcU
MTLPYSLFHSTACFIFSLILFGAVIFDEFGNVTSQELAMFFLSLMVCLTGIFMLSQRQPQKQTSLTALTSKSVEAMEKASLKHANDEL